MFVGLAVDKDRGGESMTAAVGGAASFSFRRDGAARFGSVDAGGFAFQFRRHLVKLRREDSGGAEAFLVCAGGKWLKGLGRKNREWRDWLRFAPVRMLTHGGSVAALRYRMVRMAALMRAVSLLSSEDI